MEIIEYSEVGLRKEANILHVWYRTIMAYGLYKAKQTKVFLPSLSCLHCEYANKQKDYILSQGNVHIKSKGGNI